MNFYLILLWMGGMWLADYVVGLAAGNVIG